MKKLIFFIIISFLISPLLADAYSMGMNPAKLEVIDRNLKAGEELEIQPKIWIYTDLPDQTYIKMKAECLEEQSQLCPDSSWIIFEPTQFVLEKGIGQEVKIQLKIPDKKKGNYNGDYQVILIASPDRQAEGQASVGIEIGTRLNFSIKGKVGKMEKLTNWFNENIFSKARAEIGKIGIGINSILILLSLIGIILISQKVWVKIRKRKKH